MCPLAKQLEILQTWWGWDLKESRHVSQIAVRLWGIEGHDDIQHCSYPRLEVGEEGHQSQGEEAVLRWPEEEAGAPGLRVSVVAAGRQRLADSTGSRQRSFGNHHKRHRGRQIRSTGHTQRCSRR